MKRFLILLIVTTLITGFFLWESNNPGTEDLEAVSEKFQQREHPYGNPVKGPMPWEFSKKLQKMQEKYRAYVRLSAFKAKLPDPLPGEQYNIALAADLLRGSVVNAGQVFSMNERIGPYTRKKGFKPGPTYKGNRLVETMGGGVCKIASLLYNLTILADLKIVERWSHSMQVPYVPPGQDATVSYGVKDFKFRNNTRDPIIIWADTEGGTLFMAIYGSKIPPEVKWYHRILRRRKYQTIYRTNKSLRPGEKKVVIPGSDALVIKSWVKIDYPEGKTETRYLGVDYYKPMNRVIEKGKE